MSELAARPPFTGSTRQQWLSTVARWVLAGILLLAGGLKVTEPGGAVRAVQAYRLMPPKVAEYVGYGLPLLEIALGVLLLLGLGTRLVAAIVGVLMLVFIAGVMSAWLRGLSIDCGCFGGGGDVAPGTTRYLEEILRDLGFVVLAVWLVRFPASRLAVDRSGRAGSGDYGLYDELDEQDQPDEYDDEGQVGPATREENRP